MFVLNLIPLDIQKAVETGNAIELPETNLRAELVFHNLGDIYRIFNRNTNKTVIATKDVQKFGGSLVDFAVKENKNWRVAS